MGLAASPWLFNLVIVFIDTKAKPASRLLRVFWCLANCQQQIRPEKQNIHSYPNALSQNRNRTRLELISGN